MDAARNSGNAGHAGQGTTAANKKARTDPSLEEVSSERPQRPFSHLGPLIQGASFFAPESAQQVEVQSGYYCYVSDTTGITVTAQVFSKDSARRQDAAAFSSANAFMLRRTRP